MVFSGRGGVGLWVGLWRRKAGACFGRVDLIDEFCLGGYVAIAQDCEVSRAWKRGVNLIMAKRLHVWISL